MKSKDRSLRSGAAVVEMAIVAPLLVILAMGTLEATTAIHLQQSLEIAAYEGARVALLPDTDAANVRAASKKLLAGRKIKRSQIKVSPANFQVWPYGTEISVQVSTPLSRNSLVPLFVLRNRTLTAKVTMMKEHR